MSFRRPTVPVGPHASRTTSGAWLPREPPTPVRPSSRPAPSPSATAGPRTVARPILPAAEKIFWPEYSPKPLEKALADYLGDARLKDALTRVTVTAYETERRRPFFFRSTRAAENPDEYDYFMRDVARATSAAPTYFPTHKIDTTPSDHYALVDGGVFANNPGMCAYVDALKEVSSGDDVIMVSLGTGSLTRPLKYDEIKSWGEARWVQPLISVMMDGVSATTDYQLGQILGQGNYFRLQTTLDVANDEMDDASSANIENLVLQADRLIEASDATLAAICDRLLQTT